MRGSTVLLLGYVAMRGSTVLYSYYGVRGVPLYYIVMITAVRGYEGFTVLCSHDYWGTWL